MNENARSNNAQSLTRAQLEAKYGRVWEPAEYEKEFQMVGFTQQRTYVVRRSDGVKGSLRYQAEPWFYFGWTDGWE